MKKLWLPLLIISLIISIFCIFYVAVGATAAEKEAESLPDEIFKEQIARDEKSSYCAKRLLEAPKVYETGETFTLASPQYGEEGMFEMDYTVERSYFSDMPPAGAEVEKFSQFGAFSEGKLSEGYTFLCIDVILKNRDTKKQMYMMNSAVAEGTERYELRGFSGQRFKNSASLHIELFPGDVFETTLVFAVEENESDEMLLYINNFGYSNPNGTCAYVSIEISK